MCASLASISSQIKRPIASDFKLGRESFTRDGTLSPDLLISLLVYMAADGGRRGYQHLLDGFWDEAKANRVPLPTDDPVSSAAFCNARKRLGAAAVRQLLRDTSDAFDRAHGPRHRVHGRRVLAVDGCKISLQRAPELWDEFGGPSDGYVPQILVSVLFDVIAKIPVDATIAPYASDERAELSHLLTSTRDGDILVLDQGYPSYVMIDLLIEHSLDFVIRVPVVSGFPAVAEFVLSGQDEADIVLTPAPNNPAHLLKPRRLRAVRRLDPDGEPQVFLTTLPRSQFCHGDICDLYQRRWQIELFYRLEKSDYVGHRQFHAKYPEGVRQEVFAFLLFTAISRTLMAAASEASGASYERISQKSAILATARCLTVLLLEVEPHRVRQILAALLNRIAARLDPRPRHRACPRRSFTPRSRWGPHGRVHVQAKCEQLR
jgi:DDE family transposase